MTAGGRTASTRSIRSVGRHRPVPDIRLPRRQCRTQMGCSAGEDRPRLDQFALPAFPRHRPRSEDLREQWVAATRDAVGGLLHGGHQVPSGHLGNLAGQLGGRVRDGVDRAGLGSHNVGGTRRDRLRPRLYRNAVRLDLSVVQWHRTLIVRIHARSVRPHLHSQPDRCVWSRRHRGRYTAQPRSPR